MPPVWFSECLVTFSYVYPWSLNIAFVLSQSFSERSPMYFLVEKRVNAYEECETNPEETC